MADQPSSDAAAQPNQEQPAQTAETAPTATTTDPTQDEQKPDGQQPSTEPQPPAPKNLFSGKHLLIIAGILIVGLSALFAVFLPSGTEREKTPEAINTTTDENLQPTLKQHTEPPGTGSNNPEILSKLFVYGAWSGQTSLIKAVDLASQTTKVVATLSSSIKKVSVLSPQTIIFIDETDKRDHGKKLVTYNIKTKSPQSSIVASPGFGIDDYVLSPDKRYIAIWEVSFAPNAEILMGGKSRVYVVDLKRPTIKTLLYDETATVTNPVHYPRAVLNNGRVFADKFLPNDPKAGSGWAYGLSVVEVDTTNKQDLQQMQHGSYGTQPSLSPDGKYLLFSGYDGSRGDGKATNGGYRQALLTPNTVELLDTQTFNRQKLPNLENSNIYSSAEWDASSGKIVLTVISREPEQSGVYTYDLTERKPVKLRIPSIETTTYGFLTELNKNTTIIGSQDTNASNLGNLGDTYAFPFTQIALMDTESLKVNFVKIEDTFAQFLTILPGDYFKDVLGIQANVQPTTKPTFVDMYAARNETEANQQLYTFIVKYDLLKTRLSQQSTPLTTLAASDDAPKCEQLAEKQCQQQGLTEADGYTYKTCIKTNKDENKLQKGSGLCSGSPLYLYGPEGMQVDVQIQTPVFNALPAYENGFTITLQENGKMKIHGKSYARIAYDYSNNSKRVTPPKNGVLATRDTVEKVLKEYADKLGLNEKETQDLVNAGKQKLTADYAFISFFDQETSERILPISFSPAPDNYLNVVFYFKNLDERPIFTPLPPIFPKPITRTGFTAVEISEIVE